MTHAPAPSSGRAWWRDRAPSAPRWTVVRRSRACTSAPVPRSRSLRCSSRVRAAGLRIAALKDGVLERVGTTVTPQPVLAVASASPSDPEQLGRDGLVLIGAGLADPGNVGTLLRSAEAAGAAGIVLSAGSVDAYNPKVVRASAGAIFGVALVEGWTVMEALDAMRATGRTCVGTRAEGGVAYHETDLARPTAVVLGNEAHGLPADLGAALDGWVTVPMRGPAESLNVAMAGTVLCFEAGAATRRRAEAAVNLAELEDLLAVSDDALGATVAGATDPDALVAAERALVGRGSPMNRANEAIKGLDPAERPAAGKAVGAYKARVAAAVDARRAELAAEAASTAPLDALDLTLGGHARPRGHLHLVTQIQRELEDIFCGMGYLVMEGPEVEDDWHNFEALNMVPGHPAALHAGHALRRAGRARADPAPHPHVAGADPHDGADDAADPRGRAGPRLPQRDARPAPLAGVPPDRGARRRSGHHARRPVRHHRDLRAGDAARRARAHPLPPRLLPVHRAVGRARGELHLLRRCRVSGVLADGVDRARRLRDGRSRRARGRRHRPGGVHGLRVRLRPRAHRDDPVRDRRDQDVLRRRRALPGAVLRSRAPLSWIQEFTPVDAPVADIVAALNQLGLEVDGVEQPGAGIVGVVAARVLDVAKHPDADKLSLVDVDFGTGTTRVVCGAPNVVPGMVAPFAPAGATLPGGITLERRTIRGQVSDGMLLSARELGLGDDHSGIVSLDATAELGDDVRAVLGLDDVIFDLAITPNRPDAMCVVGVARELAAHFSLDLLVPEPHAATDTAVTDDITVVIEAPERCPRYLGRVAHVTLGDSPAWMAQRLVKAGMRPISNVVDVTNYVLLERNQPLHAFDLAHLAGGIVVRLAEDGETMTTLDGVERTLTAEDLLICDAERAPQAIAGIMGGSTSEVSDATTEILLESAYFERMGIARSSKRLKLRSESSARFERGIDPDAVAVNAERAMELLVEVAGARVAADAVDEYPRPFERPRILVRTARVNAVLGTDLDAEDVWHALAPLGIDVDDSDAGSVPERNRGAAGDDGVLTLSPPSFRPDLDREIDVVEEVARRVGFDRIGRTLPDTHGQVGMLSPRQRDRRAVADALVGAGLSEAITLSLVSPADLERAGAPLDRLVRSANPLRAEESVLRTGILPGLLRAVAGNRAQGIADVALFEQGRVFLAPRPGAEPALPEEPEHVAAVLAGRSAGRRWSRIGPSTCTTSSDAWRAVTDALRVEQVELRSADVAGYQRGRAADVVVGGVVVGAIGQVSDAVVDALGLESPVVAFEVDLDGVASAPRRTQEFQPLSRFPASMIDLAFVADASISAGAIEATLRDATGALLERVRCFDEFTADSLGAGRRSLAFALRFRAPDRTLTDADVAELRTRAIDAVVAAHGAELRG